MDNSEVYLRSIKNIRLDSDFRKQVDELIKEEVTDDIKKQISDIIKQQNDRTVALLTGKKIIPSQSKPSSAITIPTVPNVPSMGGIPPRQTRSEVFQPVENPKAYMPAPPQPVQQKGNFIPFKRNPKLPGQIIPPIIPPSHKSNFVPLQKFQSPDAVPLGHITSAVNIGELEKAGLLKTPPATTVKPKSNMHPLLEHRGKSVMEQRQLLEQAKREIMEQMSKNYRIKEI